MLSFEWDDAKANANFRKHGVAFEQAAYAFRDPFGVEWLDEKADYGEERNILTGHVRSANTERCLYRTQGIYSYYLSPQSNET